MNYGGTPSPYTPRPCKCGEREQIQLIGRVLWRCRTCKAEWMLETSGVDKLIAADLPTPNSRQRSRVGVR